MNRDLAVEKPPASNEEWTAWGKVDPLYGVATIPSRARTHQNPWTDEAFYELGAVDWNFFRSRWEQYGLDPTTCVEIGCGAGRLTTHLARTFAMVHGVDVSAGMLEYARPRMPNNVVLHLGDGAHIPLDDASVTAVFSTQVLQHVASADAAANYFVEAFRVLQSGGSLMVHLPVIAWPYGSLLRAHKWLHSLKRWWDAARVQMRRRAYRAGLASSPPMQVVWYEIEWVHRVLQRSGFDDLEIRVLYGGSQMAVQHPFVFARKG